MPSTRDLWPRLLGRNRERTALDSIADAARTGHSQVLVLRGETGIGKTALLDYLVRVAHGCEVHRISGVESEKDLTYAGLHQLCRPFTRHIEALPHPQCAALSAALGMDSAAPADRWLVGLATLTLLTRAAENRPLICTVDDAHWLDAASAQTFEFVARRLAAQALGLVFAVPDSASPAFLAGLPQIVVPRLDDTDANVLLRSAVIGPLDPQVREQIMTEAHGNPLALLGLRPMAGAVDLLWGSWTPALATRTTRVEQEYVRQLRQLPAASQQMLLLAAMEPTGDASLVRRAAECLGIAPEAVTIAEDAGLIEMRDRLLFRHRLVRSAAYRVASPAERRAVHQALAEVTDAEDRRAWHRAHATVRPDEQVAAEVERGAGMALTRGGLPAAAMFLERSAALTPDPGRRAQRSLGAAEAKFRAGAFGDARSLLDEAAAGPGPPLVQARIGLLRAQLSFVAQRGNEALPLLVDAARRLVELDIELARDAYLDAFCASVFAGRLARGLGLLDVAHAARDVPRPDRQRKGDLLLDGVTAYFTEGASQAVGQALDAYRTQEVSLDEGLRSLWLATALAVEVWDADGWADLCARYLSIARESGALSELPLALNSHLYVHLLLGDASGATMLADEARVVTEAAEGTLAPYGAVSLAAWQGRPEASEMISASLEDTMSRGEGIGVSLSYWSRAVLCNSQGRYRDALEAAREASAHPYDVGVANWGLIELVEAGVKAGENTIAGEAMEQLTAKTAAGGTLWAQGIEAYAQALVNDGGRADDLYRTAISALDRAGVRAQLARAHLLYGEFLVGDGRRGAAREQLQIAGDLFTTMGYQAFAERAGQELTAAGGSFHRTEPVDHQLTAQQWRIVQLAHEGLTNPEIGAELSVSPRTVEWHLRKIFGKLGITNRRELRAALAQHPPPAADGRSSDRRASALTTNV